MTELQPIARIPKQDFADVMDILRGVWAGQPIKWHAFQNHEVIRETLQQYMLNLIGAMEEDTEQLYASARKLHERIERLERDNNALSRRLRALDDEYRDLIRREQRMQRLTAKDAQMTRKIKQVKARIAEKQDVVAVLTIILESINQDTQVMEVAS